MPLNSSKTKHLYLHHLVSWILKLFPWALNIYMLVKHLKEEISCLQQWGFFCILKLLPFLLNNKIHWNFSRRNIPFLEKRVSWIYKLYLVYFICICKRNIRQRKNIFLQIVLFNSFTFLYFWTDFTYMNV